MSISVAQLRPWFLAQPCVGEIVARAESPVYAVGGAVRDALLGRSLTDLDVAVHGAEGLARSLAGDFTVITLDAQWGVYRVVPPRGAGTFYVDITEIQGADIVADLMRRDFTINAMAVPLSQEKSELIDPRGGIEDLRCGTVRCEDEHIMATDTLRLLRAYRFASQLAAVIAPGTRSLCRQFSTELPTIARERITVELRLLFAGADWFRAAADMLDDGGVAVLFLGTNSASDRYESLLRSIQAVPACFLPDLYLLPLWRLFLLLRGLGWEKPLQTSLCLTRRERRLSDQLDKLLRDLRTGRLVSGRQSFFYCRMYGSVMPVLAGCAAVLCPGSLSVLAAELADEYVKRFVPWSQTPHLATPRKLLEWVQQPAGPWLRSLEAELQWMHYNGEITDLDSARRAARARWRQHGHDTETDG